ncbi:MAG: DNA polymerase III subunit gamma/tau [bacterium]
MAYQVLARKWRPQRFDDVVGQEHVTTTLANAIRSHRLAHAFLFCGPRGVGKTTTARILAKCLNCERAQDGPVVEPCNECASCREIGQGVSLDVLEIDGASNRGIDEIRDLRENVRYAPSRGRAKVYVIDEVHMLTKEAFNALLKTLEEPPPSVYFVFATTEEHKVPPTIRSRCQRYDFHRVPRAIIEATLQRLCAGEGFEAEPEALAELARHADGGLRDAESLLDQAAAIGEGKVTRDAVRALLGEAEDEVCLAIVEAAARGDAADAFRRLGALLDRGMDPGRIATQLAQTLRDLLVASSAPPDAASLGLRADLVQEYGRIAKSLGAARVAAFLALCGRTVSEMRRAQRPRLVLEMAIARMTRLEDPGALDELARRLEAVARRLGGGETPPPSSPRGAGGGDPGATDAAPSDSPPPRPAAPRRPSEPPDRDSAPPRPPASRRASEPPEPAPPADFEDSAEEEAPPPLGATVSGELGSLWRALLDRVGRRKRMLGSFLAHGTPVTLDDDGLHIVFENNYHEGMVLRRENLVVIREELALAAGRPLEVRARVGSPPLGARGVEAPAAERRSDPRDLLAVNPGLKRVIDELGGQILPGTSS